LFFIFIFSLLPSSELLDLSDLLNFIELTDSINFYDTYAKRKQKQADIIVSPLCRYDRQYWRNSEWGIMTNTS